VGTFPPTNHPNFPRKDIMEPKDPQEYITNRNIIPMCEQMHTQNLTLANLTTIITAINHYIEKTLDYAPQHEMELRAEYFTIRQEIESAYDPNTENYLLTIQKYRLARLTATLERYRHVPGKEGENAESLLAEIEETISGQPSYALKFVTCEPLPKN
jgi:hypothetical protein